MIITLPGYTALIQNAVYSKPKLMPAIFANGGGRVILSDVLLLMRYREPTDDEVVAHLQGIIISAQEKQKQLQEPKLTAQLSDVQLGNHHRLSKLEQKALEIPHDIRAKILDDNQEILTYVRQLTLAPPPSLGPSPTYIYIRSGLLKPNYVAHQSLIGKLNSLDDYCSAFLDPELQKKRFGEKINIRVQLSNYNLIPKKDIDTLVKYGVSGPQVAPAFEVSSEYYDKEEVQRIIDDVYLALPTPAHVKELTDVSKARLDELTLQPASGLMFALSLSNKRGREDSMIKDETETGLDTEIHMCAGNGGRTIH